MFIFSGALVLILICGVLLYFFSGPSPRPRGLPAETSSHGDVSINNSSQDQNSKQGGGQEMLPQWDNEFLGSMSDVEILFDKAQERIDFLNHLKEVTPHDRKRNIKWELPAEEIATASTEKLINHFSKSPNSAMLMLYGQPDYGVARALRSSDTLSAFFKRENVDDAIVKLFQSIDVDPAGQDASRKSVDYGPISDQLMVIDQIVLYPALFNRLEPVDEQLVHAIRRRLRDMIMVNDRLMEQGGKDYQGYSALFGTTVNLLMSVTNRSYQDLYVKLEEVRKADPSNDRRLFEVLEQSFPLSE